jgi:hypothetical protein
MTKRRRETVDLGPQPAGPGGIGPARELAQETDGSGVPWLRPVDDWLGLLDEGGAPDPLATRWLQAVLRFSRPDGSPVFGPIGRSAGRLRVLEAWAARLGDPSLSGVVAGWRSSPSGPTLPPVPTFASPDRPLAVLRPDWSIRGDLVAIDHRQPGDATLLEVTSRGKTWIGPTWTSGSTGGKFSQGRPTCWTSGTFADCVEWSFRSGRNTVTRTVVLLRGRSMALLGQQDDGPGPVSEVRLGLPAGIEASPIAGSRAILLSSGRGQPGARLIPIGLPARDGATDLGSIAIEGREVVVRQVSEGRRRWLPVLICWGKAPTLWRPLTVSYRSKAARDHEAVAARVAWGRFDEGLVVYRSLAKPSLRSFLGHQSGARFLVGAFTRAGEVRPLLKVDP